MPDANCCVRSEHTVQHTVRPKSTISAHFSLLTCAFQCHEKPRSSRIEWFMLERGDRGDQPLRLTLFALWILTCSTSQDTVWADLFLWRRAIPGAAKRDANQSFYSERGNLWCARRVTDSISTMFPLSCPMFRAVISLLRASRSPSATPFSRVTIYPTNNWLWQVACKQ